MYCEEMIAELMQASYTAFWVELDCGEGFPCFKYTQEAQTHFSHVFKVFH